MSSLLIPVSSLTTLLSVRFSQTPPRRGFARSVRVNGTAPGAAEARLLLQMSLPPEPWMTALCIAACTEMSGDWQVYSLHRLSLTRATRAAPAPLEVRRRPNRPRQAKGAWPTLSLLWLPGSQAGVYTFKVKSGVPVMHSAPICGYKHQGPCVCSRAVAPFWMSVPQCLLARP